MHFLRLRLSGFKSFVEPTEFRIEPGLTGIVGPNGCGKSNLLEADADAQLMIADLLHYVVEDLKYVVVLIGNIELRRSEVRIARDRNVRQAAIQRSIRHTAKA